ncbi:hypothetical protein GIB67_042581 [Kingdonia uniflora]|uniref:TF-B3 domain-containing protein n=1 Tax=Kingdonia uniflora TaxID=39325 RepID=A0A7J7M1A2_9MAGN|nr:hypothetical protein GIB67_042581 [Kingdonia uniflora]
MWSSTTGWSIFVSQKNLVSGDAVLFLRGKDGELRLGIRRAVRPRNSLPNSVLTDQNMHPNIFSPVSNAISTKSMFHIFYSPRLLQISGPDSCQLESVYSLLSKLEGIVRTSSLANMNQMFLSCLLHGFPSHSTTLSGALVSCVLMAQKLVYTLDALIKIKDVGSFSAFMDDVKIFLAAYWVDARRVWITADVKLSGDAIRNSDSEGTKQSLASDDGFLESPNSAGFKIRVSSEISNGQVILNVDCGMYSNDPKSLKDALFFVMDEESGHKIAFVQFPQNFNNLTPNDIYDNRLTVGNKMGLKYGYPVEDIIYGLAIQCRGWKFVYYNPDRRGLLGVLQ